MTHQLNELGLRDGLAALTRISQIVLTWQRRAEQKATEAEAELLACRAMRGFVEQELESYHLRLKQIEDAKSADK